MADAFDPNRCDFPPIERLPNFTFVFDPFVPDVVPPILDAPDLDADVLGSGAVNPIGQCPVVTIEGSTNIGSLEIVKSGTRCSPHFQFTFHFPTNLSGIFRVQIVGDACVCTPSGPAYLHLCLVQVYDASTGTWVDYGLGWAQDVNNLMLVVGGYYSATTSGVTAVACSTEYPLYLVTGGVSMVNCSSGGVGGSGGSGSGTPESIRVPKEIVCTDAGLEITWQYLQVEQVTLSSGGQEAVLVAKDNPF